MIRHLTLVAFDDDAVRDRSHLVRVLLQEALAARELRQVCDHDWRGDACLHCERSRAQAGTAPSAELVLRFPSRDQASLFKTHPRKRAQMLRAADWTQGGLVVVPAVGA